jgi:hypothetical protein
MVSAFQQSISHLHHEACHIYRGVHPNGFCSDPGDRTRMSRASRKSPQTKGSCRATSAPPNLELTAARCFFRKPQKKHREVNCESKIVVKQCKVPFYLAGVTTLLRYYYNLRRGQVRWN